MEYSEKALQTVREDRLLIDRYDAWLYDLFCPHLGQRILEIGCGMGNLLRHFLDRQLVVGIEPSNESVAHVRKLYEPYPNVRVFNQSITSPDVIGLSEHRLDTAISLNVFEHIEDDELGLRNTWQILEQDAKLIMIVPAHEWLYGTMDRSIGHYRRYSKKTLRQKMERAGFRVLGQQYINTLGALGWWFNGRVLRKTTPPSGQLKLFNALVPVLRAFESRVTVPFGISLLTVAMKDA